MKLLNIQKLSLAGVLVLRLTPTNASSCSRLFCCWKYRGEYGAIDTTRTEGSVQQNDQHSTTPKGDVLSGEADKTPGSCETSGATPVSAPINIRKPRRR